MANEQNDLIFVSSSIVSGYRKTCMKFELGLPLQCKISEKLFKWIQEQYHTIQNLMTKPLR